MAKVIHLPRTRAANDEPPRPSDGFDAIDPDSPPSGSFAVKRIWPDFAMFYRPLWARLTHWPTVVDNTARAAKWVTGLALVGMAVCWLWGG